MDVEKGLVIPSGFHVHERLYKNDKHEIIKVTREVDGKVMTLKITRPGVLDIVDLSKLSHEYNILKSLDHPGVLKVHMLHSSRKSVCLGQEYIAGETLKKRIFNKPLSLKEFFEFAIQIVDVLIYIHDLGIIHKDLNTTNILITDDNRIKVIDFGISTSLHTEEQDNLSVDLIEGTLVYISPEQTGRTSFAITNSSDLYSLGIIFYEMLTGKPPFDSADPLEVIHFHLTRTPLMLHKVIPGLPEGLSKVIGELLEKNPDDRYQSALGLKSDLEKLSQMVTDGKDTSDFLPKQLDKAGKFKKTQRLYGRDKEIARLIDCFNHISQMKSMLVLVSGYSGVGKSVVVKQLQHPVLENKGVYITGKFDQYKRNTPYSGFIEAFDDLIKIILAEKEIVVLEWKSKILSVLGSNASLVIEVIPSLELIIGPQITAPKLQPAEQEFRFRMVLLDFIYLFAEPGHPLVLFLDDLQWADLPSLSLLERILTNPRQGEILILGAYRDNEVTELHPLKLTISQLSKEGINWEHIHLEELDKKTTDQIVADSFNLPVDKAKDLSQLVYSKTKGNPFFINRFLQSIYDNGYIRPDKSGNWFWDQNELQSLSYTDNVIDLMTKELNSLPAETREVLKMGAVLGSTFHLNILALVIDQNHLQTFNLLNPALKAGYLIPTDKHYRSLTLSQEGVDVNSVRSDNSYSGFRFLHDRVQQAAYNLISDNDKHLVHLQIGRILMDNVPAAKLNDSIFDIVTHFADSHVLVEDETEKLKLIDLFLIAGRKAKDSTSYDVAVNYLANAVTLLPEKSWNTHYDKTFSVLSELGECEYLNNNHEKAEEIFKQILDFAKTKLEKLNIYYIHSSLYMKIGDSGKAYQIGKKAMLLYNIRFPENPLEIKFQAGYEMAKYMLLFSTKYRNVEKIYNLKECDDPEIIAINKFLIDIATSAYQENQFLMMIVIFRIIRFYLKHGFTDGSYWGFAGFSTVTYSSLGLFKRGLSLWHLTLKLQQRTKSSLLIGKINYTVHAFYKQWEKPLHEDLEKIIENVKNCISHGDPIFAGYSISLYLWKKSAIGTPLEETLNESKQYLDYLRQNNLSVGLLQCIVRIKSIKALVNKSNDPGDWEDEDFNEESFLKNLVTIGNKTSIGFFYNAKLPLYYYFDNYTEGLKWADTGDLYQEYLLGHFNVTEWNFFQNLIISASINELGSDSKKRYLKIFNENLKWFKMWAKGSSTNFEQQLSILLAEQKMMEGRLGAAIRLYEKAIQQANMNGLLQYEAIANERAFISLSKSGMKKQSEGYLKEAWELYYRWNAFGKCQHMLNRYPIELKDISRSYGHSLRNIASDITSRSTTESLDLNTLLKASQRLSSQLKLNDLLLNMMEIIIENAGAQRGVLVLERNGKLFLESEGNSGPGKSKILPSIPLEDSKQLPQSVIQYSWRTHENLVLNNALKDNRFNKDPYIVANKMLSVVSLPLTNQGKFLGILYLENNLIEGVFYDRRLEILNMLLGQIGISLDNAILYENMEGKVKERTLELELQKEEAERQRHEAYQQKLLADSQRKISDDLLLNILPEEVAEELKNKGTSEAKLYDNVTVLFSDFINFTSISETLTPNELVSELHHCFEAFDHITDKHGLEKIKTIGDAYLAVSGLPIIREDHACSAINAAIDIVEWVKDPANKCRFDIRVGINSGPVVAGIVGVKKYVYDIWGDTVNTAARMEQNSGPGKINISGSTYEEIKESHPCTYRGKIKAKNKGEIDMYFLDLQKVNKYQQIGVPTN
ncbi:MAG TPA: adenylate/guanylate cyclase domain-containing protein [Anditalea sp.]|nr:adenylate/guanylate cyclase domain-containing protein [Anditalea sp.]